MSAYVGEGGAVGEVGVLSRPVVVAVGGARDSAVAGVTCEVDIGGIRCDGPGGPEGLGAVIEGAGADMLAWETRDGGCYWGGGFGWLCDGGCAGCGHGLLQGYRLGLWGEGEFDLVPPVKFSALLDAAISEPFFIAKWHEEVGVGVRSTDFENGGVGEVVVVVVRDDYGVDEGDVGDVAGFRRVAFGAKPGKGRAAVFEDGVEEDAEAGGELDVIAGVTQPGCA